jgi:hypothetical protein
MPGRWVLLALLRIPLLVSVIAVLCVDNWLVHYGFAI